MKRFKGNKIKHISCSLGNNGKWVVSALLSNIWNTKFTGKMVAGKRIQLL